jgi:hypothetical protein
MHALALHLNVTGMSEEENKALMGRWFTEFWETRGP